MNMVYDIDMLRNFYANSPEEWTQPANVSVVAR